MKINNFEKNLPQELVIISNKKEEENRCSEQQTELLLSCLTNPLLIPILSRVWFRVEKQWLKNGSMVLLGVISLVWFLYRTGTRPTRVTYPCQQVAINYISISAQSILPEALTAFFLNFRMPSMSLVKSKTRRFLNRYWKPILALVIILPSLGLGLFFIWHSLTPPTYPNDVNLTLNSLIATESPASDIYVVNGRPVAHIMNLINLMGTHSLNFYKSNTGGSNQGPTGLIAIDDVIIIKINSQWNARGGTNTDLLLELIQAIMLHPDGFTGEIIVADNGQGWGTLDWALANAEDTSQSVQDVVDLFSPQYQVSTYDWSPIRSTRVDEYSEGDMTDGYWLNDTADPDTGVYVSYPKFQTVYGTYISFRYGIWNGATYEDGLKVINLPILKSHSNYGVTGACKHYMGVESEIVNGGLANGHVCIGGGGMGTILSETRFPVLNILDAIYINANPYPSFNCGPSTSYDSATRVNILMASTDPVALDYWASKYVLMPTAEINGYDDTQSMDPNNMERRWGLSASYGNYLNNTMHELIRNGFVVTNEEARMNVYLIQHPSSPN